jgi:hypothetical protein
MDQAITPAIPLQPPMPPRMIEELSSRLDQLAPSVLDKLDLFSSRIDKLAPSAFSEYANDFWQRSVLFLDILRQRGNQREKMLAHGVSSVLIYDSELVMRGDELPRPVNYSLLRVIPPEGVEIDGRKRPSSSLIHAPGRDPALAASSS